MNFVLLAVGGACGSIARYRLGIALLKHAKHGFPLGTFIINALGTLLLGILCGFGISGGAYFLLGDGFCGGFTTFSTFSAESVELIKRKEIMKSIVYIAVSICVGLAFFAGGYSAIKWILGMGF
jgi:CrcB protein